MTAAHLRELTALGIEGAALVRVVEIIEEASMLSMDKSTDVRGGPLESTALDKEEARKERDKIRKREERAAAKALLEAAEMSRDKSDASKDSPQSDYVLLPSSLLNGEPLKKERGSENARARGTRMAPGTPLSDHHRAIVVAEGIHDPEKLWVEFVDYWSDIPGTRGVKMRWDGTLRNRCRDVIKRGQNGNRTGNTRTTGHDAILAVAARKARELDRNDDLAGTAVAAGFAFGDGINRSGPRGNSDQAGPGERDHHRGEPDDQRIREGEIIPPDKDAAGVPGSRQFV